MLKMVEPEYPVYELVNGIEGSVTVDVALEGALPQGARPDLRVDGTIEIERLEDVLYVGRPAYGQANQTVSLFLVNEEEDEARRVQVRLGRKRRGSSTV